MPAAFLLFLMAMRNNAIFPVVQVNDSMPCFKIKTENSLVLLNPFLVGLAGCIGMCGI